MFKNTLAVIDESRDYVNRFLAYLKTRKNVSFEAVGFTDLDAAEKYFKSSQVDIALFSTEGLKDSEMEVKRENFINILSKQENIGKIVCLGKQRNFKDDLPEIEKFQSMESIIAKLEATFGEMKPEKKRVAAENVDILGIYALSFAENQTEIGLALAEEKSAEGRTLYINLQRFPGIKAYADEEEGGSLTEVIYVYKTNPTALAEEVRKNVIRAGLTDMLMPPRDMEDIDEIEESEWPEFLCGIAEKGGYSHIVLDMAEAFRSLIEIFSCCSRIYVTGAEGTREESGAVRRARLEEFRNYFIKRHHEELLERINGIN